MKRELPDGFELDDDKARIEVPEVHRFLSQEAYWAMGRPLEVVERSVREAARVVGLYHEGRQVGFARTFSDRINLAYLWILHTADGHGLYAKVGFGPPSDRVMERPRDWSGGIGPR